MRKFIITSCILIAQGGWAAAQSPTFRVEPLDRGLIAIPSTSGNFVSWRFLATDDDQSTTFELLRNGESLVRDSYVTNFTDVTGKRTDTYQVVTLVDGQPADTTVAVTPWSNRYLKVTLQRPARGENGGTYDPNDCSVGDVDGDGEYELFVKWNPSNAKDNSQGGITDNVFIDCYKLNGKLLWRIDLGRNIRAGAHYTQFMVYDFDGDGHAEMMCKTAPGSKDGEGIYVNQVATDPVIQAVPGTALYRTGDGRITGGQEWLTVFDGLTGKALHTIFYNPNRNTTYGGEADGSFNWDDRAGRSDYASYGNRGERYLAAVAHLDGPDAPASGIFCRGYYTFAYIWAVDFDGQRLHQKWFSAHSQKTAYTLTTYRADTIASKQTFTGCQPTSGGGSGTMYGNGNHNMSIADVDGDGCDEVIWGAGALDHDGRLLYGTGFGHGDALHLSDLNPTHPGLEMFQVHEEKGTYAWDIHDAATGEVLLKGGPAGIDNGRGIAGFFTADVPGAVFWSGDKNARSAITGDAISTKIGSNNFRIFWDGDLQEELLDGNKIDKWSTAGTSRLVTFSDLGPSSTCNSSKNTPCLSADILGDWREEVVLYRTSDAETCLAIYSTITPTAFRVPTLMHDHTYRMGVCWQNTAYNQPPHLGYYLTDPGLPVLNDDGHRYSFKQEEPVEVTLTTANAAAIDQQYYYQDGVKHDGMPAGLTRTIDVEAQAIKLSGTLHDIGTYQIVFLLTGTKGNTVTASVTITCRSNVEEPGVSVRWDFTSWSAQTVSNLKADAAASKTEGWSDVEAQATADAGGDPTDLSRDNCFWACATIQPDSNGQLYANGEPIAELRGLHFLQPALARRNLAIAVNYPQTSLGTYHGPAYLWLGGADKDYFIIPGVKEGTEIRMGVESHKSSDARGVQLFVSNDGARGTQLMAPNGSVVSVPTTYTEQTWLATETADIIVRNTNGCHIYFVEATQTESAYQIGISDHEYAPMTNSRCYDLQGRPVQDMQRKGIYIVNGRKVVK